MPLLAMTHIHIYNTLVFMISWSQIQYLWLRNIGSMFIDTILMIEKSRFTNTIPVTNKSHKPINPKWLHPFEKQDHNHGKKNYIINIYVPEEESYTNFFYYKRVRGNGYIISDILSIFVITHITTSTELEVRFIYCTLSSVNIKD